MANLIKQKKINSAIVKIVLYLSFCFAGWYTMRSSVASMCGSAPGFEFLNNDFVAFVLAGVLPIIIYLLAVRLLFGLLRHTPYLPVNEMLYALPYFYIGANIVTGLFSILYYFVPIASIWGGVVVPLISTAAFFAWYLAFICKNYVKNYNYRAIVVYFGRIYLFVAFIIMLFGLVAEVI